MANEFYITAGLPAVDSEDSPPSGDNQFFITAGLTAGDYESAGGSAVPKIMMLHNHFGGGF
jgi:hypothetical protein